MGKKTFFRSCAALLCLCLLLGATKPPELTARDTRAKVEEILRAHATHHVLTPELMGNAFQNFLDHLDPSKTYLVEHEILKWINPTEEALIAAVDNYKREDFSVFEEMHQVMLRAIERRRQFEVKLKETPAPRGVQAADFKELKWTPDEAALYDRLLQVKGLQHDIAEKLDPETKATFFQRMEKRQLKREEELIAASLEHQKQIVLCYFLKSASNALDSQTHYFTPAEANQFMMQVQQRLYGIGAQLRDDLTGITVVRILENSPASQGNQLRINDRIIAVNNEPVVGMDITEAVELIRGPQGTPVNLTLLRKTEEQEEKVEVQLIRGEVVLKETRTETAIEPFGNGVIGILKLYSFYQDSKYSSSSDLLEALNSLKKEHNLQGVILDLRNNAGGLLHQAVAVAGLFMNKGVVVSVKDNTGAIQRLRNIESKIAWDGPLMILSTRTSASAAEIVAQTLQEYGRALIVGDPESYGKGTFQTFTLEASNYGKVNPKGEYKVTRGRYYTVSGKSPQMVGCTADIVVPGIFSSLEIGEKHSKFPLATDAIGPSFEDDLSDIPAIHRNQVMRLYKFNLQPVMKTYQPFLPILKNNSALRQKTNLNYKNFSEEIARKDFSGEPLPSFGQTDLQLAETVSLMKDLLTMMQLSPAKAS